MSKQTTIAPVLVDKIPEFAKELYPRFVQYMRDYIEFLEQDENFLRVLLDWHHNMEPSNNVEPYIDALLRDLGFESGQNLAVDKNLLLHLLRDFYLTRGSESSFRFLFRALFNEDVELRYPRDQILVPSHAAYGKRHFIFTTAQNRDTEDYKALVEYVRDNSGTIRGLSSEVVASIENIVIQHGSGRPYLCIEILKPSFEFEVDEIVIIESGPHSIAETIKPIVEIEIVEPGFGYTENDKIQITGPTLQGQVEIDVLSKGGITAINFDSTSGWNVGDYIKANTQNSGFGFAAYVTGVSAPGGTVTKYKISNEGYNYSSIPKLTSHNSVKIEGISTLIGGIKKINVITPYVDFTDVTFTIDSETGSGAVLRAKQVTRWESSEWYDRRGFIGENSTLIDSDKYQQYSYTIVSSLPASNYDRFVEELLHPAGYIKSSLFEIESHLSLSLYGDDIEIGIVEGISFDSDLELPFDASFDIETFIMIVTDNLKPISTSDDREIIVS